MTTSSRLARVARTGRLGADAALRTAAAASRPCAAPTTALREREIVEMTERDSSVGHRGANVRRRHPRSGIHTSSSTVAWLVPVLMSAALACACVDRNHVYSIPRVHGRVVDAATKKPIAGMTIVRRLMRERGLGPGGSEDWLVTGSRITVTSDSDGRFELPGWRSLMFGIDRLDWFAFKSGYMPGKGWFRRPENDPQHPGYDGAGSDPWVRVRFVKASGTLEMNLQVSRPTLEGIVFRYFDGHRWRPYTPRPGDTDPWAEYFNRLRILAAETALPSELVVFEASRFASQHALSEGMLFPLDDVLERTRQTDDPVLRTARDRVLRGISEACMTTPRLKPCQTVGIWGDVHDYQLQFGPPREMSWPGLVTAERRR